MVDGTEVLDNSYDREEAFTFSLDAGEVIQGWEYAVRTMCVGEQSMFTIHPELAYGAAGCGGGAVPPHSALSCQLELKYVEAAASVECADDALPEERLQAATCARDAGNADFRAGRPEYALKAYEQALQILEWKTKPDTSTEEEDNNPDVQWQDEASREARRLLILACALNLAQCCLKLKQYGNTLQHCKTACKLDPKNTKALYRKGLAHMSLGYLQEAVVDLREAAHLDPNSCEIRAQLDLCMRKCQAAKVEERAAFGGMFQDNSC